MDLVISLSAEAPDLAVIGEVYRSPVKVDQSPEVSDVIAANGKVSHLTLAHGSYEYRFHIEAGVGKCSMKVSRGDTGQTIASKDYDTKFGFHGKVLSFEVA
jgi:hypothetical protein